MTKIAEVMFTEKTSEDIMKIASEYIESYYPDYTVEVFMSRDTIRVTVYDAKKYD